MKRGTGSADLGGTYKVRLRLGGWRGWPLATGCVPQIAKMMNEQLQGCGDTLYGSHEPGVRRDLGHPLPFHANSCFFTPHSEMPRSLGGEGGRLILMPKWSPPKMGKRDTGSKRNATSQRNAEEPRGKISPGRITHYVVYSPIGRNQQFHPHPRRVLHI